MTDIDLIHLYDKFLQAKNTKGYVKIVATIARISGIKNLTHRHDRIITLEAKDINGHPVENRAFKLSEIKVCEEARLLNVTLMTTEREVITALQNLINKGGYEGGIQGWVNGIYEDRSAEESAEIINDIADNYSKSTALFQIAVLMETYRISIQDIESEIARLKVKGWPDYKEV